MDTREQFLVIGAGPVGLAIAKALGEQGVPYVQVEATGEVGGNWAHGVYETAHIISSRKTTEYPDFPMPADYPDFPSAEQMFAYFQRYADAFALREHIRFHTRLEHCAPEGRLWRCDFSDGRSELFKGVYVCNGHHWKKNLPAWAGDFTGEVLHSKDYKRPDQLRDKRVLVVGAGNSGCDLASEAARVGAHADWSMRRGTWILPKTFLGKPSIEYILPWVPVFLQRAFVRASVRIAIGRYRDYGLPEPTDRPLDRHPTVNSEVFHYLQHGSLTHRGGVERVEGRTVHFTDGSTEDYDLIACATGFDLSFPFLAEGVVPMKNRKVADLIGGFLVRGRRHLYVCGAYQVRFGLGPVTRPFAELAARWARLQDELDVPLADVLYDMGQRAPETDVMDPHAAIRQIRRAGRMESVIRWRARRLERQRATTSTSTASAA